MSERGKPPLPDRPERFRVHLEVRYGVAAEFVLEYAENLSRAGLFLPGAYTLEARQEVSVEVTLPGAGRFPVLAEVAHILTREQAAKLGRRPGAGLAITRAPEDFKRILADYLARLGRRRDVMVMVEDAAAASLLSEAGYVVCPLPPVDELVTVFAQAALPVLAVVVPSLLLAPYREAIQQNGGGDIVLGLDDVLMVDALLERLDAML